MNRQFLIGGVSALALLACSDAALAHGDHGGGGDTVVPAGVTLVTLQYDVVTYKPLTDAQLLAAEPGPHAIRRIAVPSLSLAYGLTRDFTVAVRLPYLANSGLKELDEDTLSVVDRGGVYGLGDASFTGTWRFYNDTHRGFEANLVFGVKTPTGRTDAVDRFGERFETHHQPGSGSWDGLIGARVSQQIGTGTTLAGNVLFAKAGDGTEDTNVGDRLSYGVVVTHTLWSSGGHDHGAMKLGAKPDGIMYHGGHSHADPAVSSSRPMSFDISLGINGQWSDKVRTAGVIDPDTGGNLLFLTPGMRLTVGDWATFVNVGIPIAKDLNGLQSEPDWQLSTGLAVKF